MSHLNRFVITCFLFAFLSVVEYAAVNHFMYNNTSDGKIIGRHIDTFFKYTAGPLWILVVALFFLQQQVTQAIMFVFASLWFAAGSIVVSNDVYKALRGRPGCLRVITRLSAVRNLPNVAIILLSQFKSQVTALFKSKPTTEVAAAGQGNDNCDDNDKAALIAEEKAEAGDL
jgi:hypothetical protein